MADLNSPSGAITYLIIQGAGQALDWYQRALGACELVRLTDPSGKVMHAELSVFGSNIMLADEFPDMGYLSPTSRGGSTVSILLYVPDVDAVFAQAIALGGVQLMPVADQFDGDRRGTLKDPFGHVWLLATSRETISMDELRRRFDQMMNEEG